MRYPGPKSQALIADMQKYVKYDPWPFALDLSNCDGMYLSTIDHQRIFDWAGYYGSKLIGHNHPRLQEPDYIQRLVIAANNKTANPDFVTQPCVEYYKLLYSLAPASMQGPGLEVYAVNSGAEAVENMLKYFVSLHNAKHGPSTSPRQFIYFERAFHGRTVYALNVTETTDPVATRDFRGLVAGTNIRVPFPARVSDAQEEVNDASVQESLDLIEAILKTQASDIVGIIVEPIQGAGGQRVTDPLFFAELSRLAHDYGVYLGFDEVQTSGGATGSVFAIEQFGMPYPPDAIAVGKKFACGALFMRQVLPDIGVLDSTWGGGLSDMVRFVQEWKVVEQEDLVAQSVVKGERLSTGLRYLQSRHPNKIGNVRGMGLYQGFSLLRDGDKGKLTTIALQDLDLLLLGAGSRSIRTRPNLSVSTHEIELFLDLLDQALDRL